MNALENLPGAVVLTLIVLSALVGGLATTVAFLLRKEPTTKPAATNQPPAKNEPDFAQVQSLLAGAPELAQRCSTLARRKKRKDLRRWANFLALIADHITEPDTGRFLLLARASRRIDKALEVKEGCSSAGTSYSQYGWS